MNSTELGRVTLSDDPKGWDAVKKQFFRNLSIIGVFRKRTAELEFVGDGLDYCIELYQLKGTEAVMDVTVMRKVDYQDAWELEFQGIGKFNPFDLEWDGDLSPSVKIDFEDSGFHVKFLTRLPMMVNIGDEETIEGLDIGPMPTKDIQVHQRIIQENNIFKLAATSQYDGGLEEIGYPPYIHSDLGHVLPFEKVSGDTDFVSSPTDYLLTSPSMLVDFVTQPTAVNIKGRVTGTGHSRENSLFIAPDTVGIYVRKYTDSTDLTVFTVVATIYELSGISPTGSTLLTIDESPDINITLDVGEALSIVFFINETEVARSYDVTYTLLDFNISLIQNFDEYVSKGHYRYEFMKRLAQIITDQDDCFKSNIFGRTELGYVTNGAYYNNVLFNGKQLRGFDSFPVWSLEKALKSVQGIWNVGCGIEKFGSRFKVVVEDLPYFFRGTISITLHNVTKIKRVVADDFTFSEVRVGYEKAEYEQVNGLEEYNNKSTFATFIKSKQKVLDLISPERADGYGMEFARRKSKLIAQSEDTPYDNEVFVAMVNEGNGGVLVTQKDENYDSVENIQSPESATNLDITPQRNLFRNGDWIKGCVNKFPDELLKFISSDKETDLSSVRTGSSGVVEQTSVLNSSLRSSLWLNELYLYEASITPEQESTLELKPYDLIKFSPFDRAHTRKYYYGWIIDIAVGGKERKGTFTLLAANVISDRLRIVDPDGIDTTDQGTPLPPSGDDAGFEYVFEKVFES